MNFQHAIDFTICQGIVSLPFFLYKLGIKVPWDVRHVCVHHSIAAIQAGAFLDHHQLKEIVLPEGLQEIGEYAFLGCRMLERINCPSTLTAIGDEAFYCCG